MFKFIKKNPIYSLLIFVALLSFLGAVIYRFYKLNNLGIFASLVISVLIWLFLLKKLAKNQETNKKIEIFSRKKQKKRFNRFYLFFFLGLTTICFYILFTNKTENAIISPWQVVPNYFFIFYFLSAFFLFTNIKKTKNTKISLLLISIFYFLSFSVALIIYKIGYGFDPFIHTATEEMIKENGIVEPKPFYYLGQYSLIVIISQITTIPILFLDKILTPLLASIFLPTIIYKILKNWLSDKLTILLAIAFLLILPFSFFIVSTPQNLSYVFLILTIFLAIDIKTKTELSIVWLLALSTALIHPLTGIPACFFALSLTFYHSDFQKSKKIIFSLIFLFSCLALPSAFYFLNKDKPSLPEEISSPIQENNFSFPYGDNAILNAVYGFGFNFEIILIFILLLGFFIFLKNKKNCQILKLHLLISISLLISFLLIKKMPFDFLIYYERDDYALRVLKTAIIFLLPFIFLSFYSFFEKIEQQKKYTKIIIYLVISISLTTSLYLSYPRIDNYFNSHGYSTSKTDITAVDFIENMAQEDYIVLANQQVSAGALKKLGFNNYLKNGQTYFYPIPTGGELYKYYLKMVYEKPTRETMVTAMKFAEVSQGFFVLNKYWWASDKILEEAKLEADGYKKIEAGDIWIFWYNLK